jgi:hypothetical protein
MLIGLELDLSDDKQAVPIAKFGFQKVSRLLQNRVNSKNIEEPSYFENLVGLH